MNFRDIKYSIINRKGVFDKPIPDCEGQRANELLYNTLSKECPCMIARFGAFELGMSISALTPYSFINIKNLLCGEIASIGWNKNLAKSLCNNAGFFPNDKKEIIRFAQLLFADVKYCDILGSWLSGEKIISKELGENKYKSVPLFDLEPFHHENPWTKALEGKNVLVVHPYEESILHQWKVRDKLFPNMDILPEFDLRIVKAIQSAAGNKSRFGTWFDALDYMKEEMDKEDYDIALIGCGAYGFHLAAHAKRTGHKAVHLGGLLQILFGIMGKRWEGKYPFVNEYWIRPLPSDMIQNANSIENGCYW